MTYDDGFPPEWPRCVFCGGATLHGRLTCEQCPEALARELEAAHAIQREAQG